MNIIQCMNDRKLFGRWFKRGLLGGDSWRNWRVFLAALFGLGLDADGRAIYKQFTGRDDAPNEQASEAWLVCGRRSGKSLISALVAVFLSAFKDYTYVLAPGEVATVMVIACDKRQARVVLNYIFGFFDTIPILSQMMESRTKESVTLKNRVRVEVHVSSFRAVRGYSVACAILDEVAFFPTGDSATPDEELVTALRPAMATIPGALLLGVSSPYAKRGVLHQAFAAHYGKRGAPALVWKADTASMNPTVSRAVIRAAYLRDSAGADSEYGANFRSDISGFLPPEVIESCVVPRRYELAYNPQHSYVSFVDPSGGASDAMTLGIAHLERDKAVVDAVREVVPPFSPESVCKEFADVLKSYHVHEVTGDAYGGEWPREGFEKQGIAYRVSDRSRSEIYLEFLPTVMSRCVELLDNKKLFTQLCGLERRTGRSGRDTVDHGPSGHDDISNAVCGAVVEALRSGGGALTLIEYERKVARGQVIERVYVETRSESACLQPEKVPPCPSCKAICVTVLQGNNEYRCQQCGHQFPRVSEGEVPKPVLPSRSNLHEFQGTRTNMNPPGFRTAFARFIGRSR